MSKVYVTSYVTESSDRGVIGYWRKKPTERQLKALYRDLMPEEFRDGVEYVYWKVYELNPIKEGK